MQRLIALVLLLAAGVVSLPLTALGFDDQGTENWIIPIQWTAMACIGALVSLALPGLVGKDASTRRRAILGAAIGVGMAFFGVVVFFMLLNGFDGA